MSRETRNGIRYVPGKQPVISDEGIKVYSHAQEISRSYSSFRWEKANRGIKKRGIDKKNCQIFVVAPINRTGNVTYDLYFDQLQRQIGGDEKLKIGKKIVGTNYGDHWKGDGEPDSRLLDAKVGVNSVYIVGSPQNEADYFLLANTAHELEDIYGVKAVTFLLTSVGLGRQDKNTATGTKEFDFKMRNIATVMKMLSGDKRHIHRIIAIEPHSAVTHTEATKNHIDLAPISPWKYLIDEIDKLSPLDRQATVVVRPDEGRNLASQRIDQYLEVPWVPFVKHKVEDTNEVLFELLRSEDGEKLKGKEVFLYDDEGASLKTVYNLAKKLEKYGIKKIKICLVHAKLTEGWEYKLMEIIKQLNIPIEIFISDSREPIGNIEEFNKAYPGTIRKISLTPFIREIIKADIDGINFWNDERYKKLILQGMLGEKMQ
ncbi:hypothetical protein HZA75_00320 [Candidatus Roizmanbacteria bacterium]|nr:hypothetical protein [Candidatus Roizmanbacteria bacterium]